MRVERWLELRVRASGADPGLLVEALLATGGRAVYEDEGWQVTHLPDPGDARIVDRRVEQLREILAGVEGVRVETAWQRQEDWDAFWKRGLDVRRLTPRLVVAPSWIQTDPSPGDVVIVVDPGMAFGNAEHGTTRGCLRLLDGLVRPDDRLLDVGAGSGILGIAAALLGPAKVLALEADPLAIPTARENLARNGVENRIDLRQDRATASTLRNLGTFDGVMANLETGLLRPLLPGLAHAARPGGWLLISGILDHEWDGLRAEVESLGLSPVRVDADGQWRSGLFRVPPTTSGAPSRRDLR